MPKVSHVGYAVIYIHRECPVCLSLFRTEAFKKAATSTAAKVRILVVDVETLSAEERLRLWSWRLTEYGLVHRVTVPLLAIYCVDKISGEWKLVYKKEIRPLTGPYFSDPDVREILALISAYSVTCVRESDYGIDGGDQEEEEKSGGKRRRKSAS